MKEKNGDDKERYLQRNRTVPRCCDLHSKENDRLAQDRREVGGEEGGVRSPQGLVLWEASDCTGLILKNFSKCLKGLNPEWSSFRRIDHNLKVEEGSRWPLCPGPPVASLRAWISNTSMPSHIGVSVIFSAVMLTYQDAWYTEVADAPRWLIYRGTPVMRQRYAEGKEITEYCSVLTTREQYTFHQTSIRFSWKRVNIVLRWSLNWYDKGQSNFEQRVGRAVIMVALTIFYHTPRLEAYCTAVAYPGFTVGGKQDKWIVFVEFSTLLCSQPKSGSLNTCPPYNLM